MALDFGREKELFSAALDIADPPARLEFLDRECGDNVALRQRLDALLHAHAHPHAALDQPLVEAPLDETGAYPNQEKFTPVEGVGSIIAGKYKLLQVIGEGGMGTVFMADQLAPVKRRVAVKLIREHRDSAHVMARFEAERQALALMDHPNIARVLDGGTTGESRGEGRGTRESQDNSSSRPSSLPSRPYFVMELVKGISLIEFCDQNRLNVSERLTLFMQVCGAVQHAHQKGIIHRDLKPTNILIESHDGKPVPKVIDFGLAKATSGMQLTENTLFTALGTVAGTPLYMAPEQATFNAIDIDTRADIYALGVLLYELLTGSTPIERGQLKKAAFEEMLRLVREEEPPTPSKRLSASASTPSIAANRHTEPAKLGRFVKGDLDWIVMKALAKERDRRYETASGFAKDVERFLNHEPVSAGPPSASYRLKKFVRRNRGQVIAASLILLALVGGIIGTTLGLFEAWRQEEIAVQAREDEKVRAEGERQAKLTAQLAQENEANERTKAEKAAVAEKTANEQTQRRLIQIEKGTDILGSIFHDLDPRAEEKEGKELRLILAERLKAAAAQLDGDAIGDPLTVAKLQNILGESLFGTGEYAEAIGLLKKAVATRKAKLRDDHEDTINSRIDLGRAYRDAGNLTVALGLFEQSLKASAARWGNDHPITLIVLGNLARTYHDAEEYEQAIRLYQRTLKAFETKRPDDHPAILVSRIGLATAYQRAGKLDLAIPLFQSTLKAQKEKLGEFHPHTLICGVNLASAYAAAKKFDLAIPLYQSILRDMEAKLGEEHPATLTACNNLASAYNSAGKPELAIPLLVRTLKSFEGKLGKNHTKTLDSGFNLARAYQDAGKSELAVPLFERGLKIEEERNGKDHARVFSVRISLAKAYLDTDRFDLAISICKGTLNAREAKLPNDHPDTLASRHNLADAYRVAGKLNLAISLYERTLKEREGKLGEDHFDTLITRHNLAVALVEAGRPGQAIPLFERTLKIREVKPGVDHVDTLLTRHNLAVAYRAVGNLRLAIQFFERTLKAREAKLGENHIDTVNTRHHLGNVYRQIGKPALAVSLLERTLTAQVAKLGEHHIETLATSNDLAMALEAVGKLDQAIQMLEHSLKGYETKWGAEHPHAIITRGNLAHAYQNAHKPDLAIPLYERLLIVYAKSVGLDHPKVLEIRGRLAKAFFDTKRADQALQVIADLLVGYKKRYGANPPAYAGVLANVSLNLLEANQFSAAEKYLRESLALIEKHEPEGWALFDVKSILGAALSGQKEYADAEPLLVGGYEGLKQRETEIPPQVKNLRLQEAVDRLAQLYEAWGKKDIAAKWRAVKERYEGKVVGPVREIGKGLELTGNLDAQNTTLIYQVKLSAGKTYVIDMTSPDQKSLDPYLILKDAAGKKLAEDDDGGGELNARITFRPTADGAYRILATSFGNRGVGGFTLTVRESFGIDKD